VLRLSYTGRAGRRQSPAIAIAAAFTAILASAGCARLGLPMNEAADGIDPIQTASLVSATVNDRVDPSDWSAVRQTLAQIPAAAEAGTTIDWWNDITNSTGTVGTLSAASNHGGKLCRSFATTINDLRGIRRYRGEACRGSDGWHLSGVARDDGAVL
jgi:surface antigen